MSLRQEKIEATFLKEISKIIQFELKDPHLGFVTISDVKVTNDLSYAKVYVSFLGKDERNMAGLKTLNRAKGFIRSSLSKRLNFRKVPELTFILDEKFKEAQRIEGILNKIKEENI